MNTGKKLQPDHQLNPETLQHRDLSELPSNECDVIILSEVLEHQSNEQASDLLKLIVDKLTPSGKLLLTVPNGYGWFEFEQWMWKKKGVDRIFETLRIEKILDFFYVIFRSRAESEIYPYISTIDSSPHLQKFTLNSLRKTVEKHDLTG